MARRPTPAVVMAAIAFGVFVAADDLTVVSTMLRQIIGDLEIPLPSGFDDAAWIVNSYLIAYVAVMPFMGRLSDLVGRRKVYVGALVVFLAGSLWIPFTTSLGWFIAARVLTAIGGGAMVPVALAVIGDLYEEDRRPRAYGILGAVDTIGWVWGPLFGAMLVRFLDWRWQFYLNVPLALIGIAVAWWALRDFDRPTARAAVDWPGAATLTVALVSLNIALLDSSEISVVTELSELAGETSGSTTWLFGVAAVFFVAFWLIERRRTNPIIDPALFRARNFTAGVGVNFLVGAVLIIAMVDVPLFVNLVVETSLLDAAVMSGWVLSGLTAAMALTSYLGGIATERTWYRPVIIAGLIVVSVGFLVVGSAWDAEVTAWTMAWQLVILGAGFGLVTAPTNSAVVDAAPSDQLGTAAGLVIVSRLMGLAVGLSGLTAWTLYRFDRLRQGLDLPAIGDPGYQDALEAAQAEITAQALTETFLFAAVVAVVAVVVALTLQRMPTRADSAREASDQNGTVMPANLNPEYRAAEAAFKKARDPQERLDHLREMLRVIPKHKGTDHLQADLKTRIKELNAELAGPRKGGARTAPPTFVHPEGAAQVALLGPPNTGKSALHDRLTGSHAAAEAYPFTTQYPQPGMFDVGDVSLQLVDLPPISPEHPVPWIANALQSADGCLFIVDVSRPGCAEETLEAIELLAERKVQLAPYWPADEHPDQSDEDDPFTLWLPTVLVASKSDIVEHAREELEALEELTGLDCPVLSVSAVSGEGFDELGGWLFERLAIVRVYTKKPGGPIDDGKPYTVRRGDTVLDVARLVHRDIAASLKYARLVGGSGFEGQQVGRDHVVADGDVLELHA